MYVLFGSSALGRWSGLLAAAAIAAVATGCGGTQKAPAGQTPATAAATSASSSAEAPARGTEDALPPPVDSELPEGIRVLMDKPFTGDFDEMVKRRMIRLGVTYNRTFYFIDKGVPRGVVYEYGKLFEDELNKKLQTGNMKVHVVFVPLPRPMLASALLEGRVDAVIAQVTITPDRQKLVDFTDPTRKNVSEVVVTGPGAPAIATIDDLSGKEIYVRKGGTYHQTGCCRSPWRQRRCLPPSARILPSPLSRCAGR